MNPESLREDLEARLGRRLGSCRITPVGGGDINRALKLEAAGETLFVKYNRADRLAMFEAERRGLEAIAQSASVRVPAALAIGCCEDIAYLALEFVELRGNPAPDAFSTALAAMHASGADAFGFDVDNTIGSTPQSNRWTADWLEFWREQRLGAQLRLGAESGRFGRKLLDRGARLGENLAALFGDYRFAGTYKQHPDPRQEQFFFALLKECLENGVLSEGQLKDEMRRNHVRHDALDILAKTPPLAA